ncbi:uncharacterized protein LOC112549543 [Alligator sinensis]|uniref:Uncharacterized protein LOC112549543 n=1 Tax=Alligator sinensis TaxID=38654 RepID=A0A3Q0G7V1_ALLSI|nr:uncharacterized protein LOC112549543 [Alligator sinensis]
MPLTATAHSRVKQLSRLLRELDTGPGSCSLLHRRWRKHEAIWIRSLTPGVGPFGSTLACLHLGGILHRASQNEGAHVFLCVHGRKSRIPPAVSARLQFKSPFTPSARVVVGLTCASICRGETLPLPGGPLGFPPGPATDREGMGRGMKMPVPGAKEAEAEPWRWARHLHQCYPPGRAEARDPFAGALPSSARRSKWQVSPLAKFTTAARLLPAVRKRGLTFSFGLETCKRETSWKRRLPSFCSSSGPRRHVSSPGTGCSRAWCPRSQCPTRRGGQKTFLAGQVSTQQLCKQQAGPLGKDQKPCGKKISIKDELGVNSSGSSLPGEVRSWRQARLGRRMDANII